MTEDDFESLVQKTGAYDSLTDAKIALDSVMNSLIQSLEKSEDVTLEGLGIFTVTVVDVGIKGPALVPGYPKKEFHKNPFSAKVVKIEFDNILKNKVNNL